LALGDGLLETRRVDSGVDSGCADVGVPRELADDDHISTGVGKVRRRSLGRSPVALPTVLLWNGSGCRTWRSAQCCSKRFATLWQNALGEPSWV
jgi:hypothetical protein